MVLDRISENIASLVQQGMYDNINTDDNTLNGLYDIQFLSNVYTIQNSTTIDGQVIFLANYLSRHNIFDPCKNAPIGIGNNNLLNRPLYSVPHRVVPAPDGTIYLVDINGTL